jgi:TPR repeat protein
MWRSGFVSGLLVVTACGRPAAPRSASEPQSGAPQAAAVPREPQVDEGIDLEIGKRGAADPRAAEELYETACLAGDPAGCHHFELLQRTRRIVDIDRRKEIAAPFEAACERGEMRGCYRVAMLLDDDNGLALDGARAFELFERACAGGYAYACVRAGTLWIVGPPAKKPEAKVTVAARAAAACDAGFPGGCDLAAGLGDATERARLRARSCEHGGLAACFELAHAAIPKPEFACDQCPEEGGPDECTDCRVAQCRRDACCPTCADRERSACCADEGGPPREHPLQTTPVDPQLRAKGEAQARTILDRVRGWLAPSCERGHPRACADLARTLDDEALPDSDPKRARALFEQACTAGEPSGCEGWAQSLAAARGGPLDPEALHRARVRRFELYRQRCDAGDTTACWATVPNR